MLIERFAWDAHADVIREEMRRRGCCEASASCAQELRAEPPAASI